MINCTKIEPTLKCNVCSHIQSVDSTHCSACGKSFVFGEPDAWTSTSLMDDAKFDNPLNKTSDDIDKEIDEYFAKHFPKKPKKVMTEKPDSEAITLLQRAMNGETLDKDMMDIISKNFTFLLD